jgi:putative DNA primase/helicase
MVAEIGQHHRCDPMEDERPEIYRAALAALAGGISVVPPAEDGTKRPFPDGNGRWKRFQERPSTEDDLGRWYGPCTGMGFVLGAVSGGLEVLEFDDRETYERFKEAAKAVGLSDLVDRIEAGYVEETPGGGVHWPYRCSEVRGNTKLAQRGGEPDEAGRPTVECLIETRGEGGFVVTAPSFGAVHPTGRPYRLIRGSISTIADISDEEREALWTLARSFDEMPAPTVEDGPKRQGSKEPRDGELRPGEDYNQRASWEEILEGWIKVFSRGDVTYWRRPGKSHGISATTGHCKPDLLRVFSTSTAFGTASSYSKFGAYAHLHHGDDYGAAAKALAEEGFGTYWDAEQQQFLQNPRPKGRARSPTTNGASHPPLAIHRGEDGPPAGGTDGHHGPATPEEAVDDPHRLARAFLSKRHSHRDGSTLHYWNEEWHRWNGEAWRVVGDREIAAELTGSVKSEFDAYANLAGGAPKPVTTRGVSNVSQALRHLALLSTERYPRQPTWLDPQIGEDLPHPLEVLAASNAIVHLPSVIEGTPATMPPTPRFFSPNTLGYGFEQEASSPGAWLEFLGSLWPDDPESIAALQEWFGYLLTPDTSQQKILMMIGPKRSGKGTIGRVLRSLVGPSNVAAPTLSGLATTFGLQPLIGKTVAIIADARLSGRADGQVIAERLLSISGEDAQSIDRKYLSTWTGELATRFVLISNELPRLNDSSGALPSRMIPLRLTKSFFGEEDTTLTARLLSERPAILRWAIDGWGRLRTRGHFLQPESGKELLDELDELSSPVGAFVAERCRTGPDCTVPVKKLFETWQSWCKDNGRDHSGDAAGFGRNLRAVLPQLKTGQRREGGARIREFNGIELALVPSAGTSDDDPNWRN